MSGGPSRGTRQRLLRGRALWPHPSKNTLILLAALEENSVTIVEHAFVAASENGFMVSRSDE
ncbi:hypothetical protein BGW80DRAFT_1389957, partial [Lactifluus volemus]